MLVGVWLLLLCVMFVRCSQVVVCSASLLALFYTPIYLAILLIDVGLLPVFTIVNKAGILKHYISTDHLDIGMCTSLLEKDP